MKMHTYTIALHADSQMVNQVSSYCNTSMCLVFGYAIAPVIKQLQISTQNENSILNNIKKEQLNQ